MSVNTKQNPHKIIRKQLNTIDLIHLHTKKFKSKSFERISVQLVISDIIRETNRSIEFI